MSYGSLNTISIDPTGLNGAWFKKGQNSRDNERLWEREMAKKMKILWKNRKWYYNGKATYV